MLYSLQAQFYSNVTYVNTFVVVFTNLQAVVQREYLHYTSFKPMYGTNACNYS